jgi:large conductance mechanosensitive channel
MLKDFRDFVLESDFVALATGLIVGGAVGALVTSIVRDFVTPLIALATGGTSFDQYVFSIPGTKATFAWGNFITVAIDTVIILGIVFLIIRAVERLKRDEEAKEKDCPYCFSSIAAKATRCPRCTSELEPASKA